MGQHPTYIRPEPLQTFQKRRQATQFSAGTVTITRTSRRTETRILEEAGKVRPPRQRTPAVAPQA